MKFLITGGAGFIGSAVIRRLINETQHLVVNLDKLTYAGDLQSLESISASERYSFIKGDICDKDTVDKILKEHEPDIIMHLAAESHVDRSIDSPIDFINTNIFGSFVLLEAVRKLNRKKKDILFHHVSTDEVFGDLEDRDQRFSEENPYDPSSPYSASKAASDHLVRSWGRTFDLSYVLTNCSNNFGPYQFPEKLIPNTILKALREEEIPIYGNGKQIRDWLFVDEHAEALIEVAINGKNGETYNIGANNSITNLSLVNMICKIMDDINPKDKTKCATYSDLITFVKDRPGHDRHYAIDPTKIKNELGWQSKISFEDSLKDTIGWYLKNDLWIENILRGKQSLERIGLYEGGKS